MVFKSGMIVEHVPKKLDGLDGFGRTLPDYVVYEILQKSGVELNMTLIREHYSHERYYPKIRDFVLGLNTNLCFIKSTSTAIPTDADPEIQIYVPYAISINRILSTENGIRYNQRLFHTKACQ
ncbi:hypothetical protein T4E_7287 [Trichinella pseudospiralis]|uniref:Uncharacterized protein n=1 Tax=Trichinella pseudospiralis TaxID=6337 RepID=A0A0V0XEA2_TRIPS|nr:hypothetical protein T4E_7287 [Trichinella pseudospiralis]